jgi:sugar lactone lactonase YvrE
MLFLALAMMLAAEIGAAHEIADVRMSVAAPPFVASRQAYSYLVIADNLANDSAHDVVVTSTLPSSARFVNAAGDGWTCTESKGVVTCSAEEIPPERNVITIDITAPAASGSITASVSVTSLGSVDPNPSNDAASVTTTVYDPAACPASSLQLLSVSTGTWTRLSWTAVPNAKSYAVYTAVEGEEATVAATTNGTSISLPIERGNVDWHVEASLGTCPTIFSAPGHFLSAGRPATLAVSTYAGRSDRIGALDGSRAEATFTSPAGLALDSAGHLFVADAGSFAIREIAGDIVTTPAGTPLAAGAADGRPASFAGPMGITISPGDDFLFIADRENQAVRLRYPGDRLLGFVTTIAGAFGQPGAADGLPEISRLSAPSAIASDPRGRLYVADSGTNRIRKLTSVPGYVGYYETFTFAGSMEGAADGLTTDARFRNPSGVAADGELIVYVADTGNHTIRKIVQGFVGTVAGLAGTSGSADGYGAAARFNAPTAIAVDARGNLYVCDTGNHVIRKVSPSGMVTTVAGLAGTSGSSDGIGSSVRLSAPSGIAIDANGTIYIADTGNHTIRIAHVAIPSGERRRSVRP